MKLIGIDFGEKRVGIASTDEAGKFALPRVVLANDHKLLAEVKRLAQEWEVGTIVMGESRNYKGAPNPIDAQAQEFAKALEAEGLKVVFHPELLTSAEAERLQGRNDMLDASAAAIILKSYLDTQKT